MKKGLVHCAVLEETDDFRLLVLRVEEDFVEGLELDHLLENRGQQGHLQGEQRDALLPLHVQADVAVFGVVFRLEHQGHVLGLEVGVDDVEPV